MSDQPLVLAIESSCDETGVAFARGWKLLGDTVASSLDEHARYGGVIPEIASRAHLEAMIPTLRTSAQRAEADLADIDAIAVTAGPGLVGSLTVGISAAKALGLALDKPVYGVNHIIGHVLVDQFVDGPFTGPVLALVVSGGHSNLLKVDGARITEIGQSLDDAAGEAFDKVGRLLGLPYPGGPHIDKAAQQGNPRAIDFPMGLMRRQDLEKHPYDFSFSGVKTAAARYIEAERDAGREVSVPDVSASFSRAVVEVLVRKTLKAADKYELDTLVIGGGFSANSMLREQISERAADAGLTIRIPPIRYCTDNGAMIAAAGMTALLAGEGPSPLDFGADSSLPMTDLVVH